MDSLKLIPEVERRLKYHFGEPEIVLRDPGDELIRTILSQNTNDRNRDRAFLQLKEKFPTWDQVLEVSEKTIGELIRPAGLENQKAHRIKKILSWLKETNGGFNLEFIEELNDDEAIALLTTQKGIGLKTAGVVLAFAFGRDLCPVDTHIHRIAHRLGWVMGKASPKKIFYTIKPHIPSGRARSLHLNLLRLGRIICTARQPNCRQCPLTDLCCWYQTEKI
ncbi:MAG: endonuclease III domain-containing protein [bacterium]